MISAGQRLKHYKRGDVQKAMVNAAENREVAVRFGDKGFGRRPDVLMHPTDVLEFAKKGATSFHVSEEAWSQVLRLDPSLKKQELQHLRQGWDLVIDIDCPLLDYSKVAAHWVITFLQSKGVKSVCVKFSGNHGFHIAVPSQAFPKRIETREGTKETRELFPEAPRRIAEYIAAMIRVPLGDDLIRRYGFQTIVAEVDKPRNELVAFIDGKERFDPFTVLAIDTVLIASRHLYRMPYSFHEKSGLVSIPIDPTQVLTFDTAWAEPARIKRARPFIPLRTGISVSAGDLLVSSLDYSAEQQLAKQEKPQEMKHVEVPETAYATTLFPPCIAKLHEGLHDGRKRMTFALINFLASAGWSHDQINAYIRKWNETHEEPLRETFLVGQLRYAKQRKTPILPPNCDAPGYWKETGVCCPDGLCRNIKNPIQYVKRRAFIVARQAEEEEKERAKAERKKKREEAAQRRKDKQEQKKKKELEANVEKNSNKETKKEHKDTKKQEKTTSDVSNKNELT